MKDSITLTKQEFRELMNEAAKVALELEKNVSCAIKGKQEANSNELIRKSIASIAGDALVSRIFNNGN